MPPKGKAAAKPKAAPKSAADPRKSACAALIGAAFPEFAGDDDFYAELAGSVVTALGDITSRGQLSDPLEMALAGKTGQEIATALESVYAGLVAAGLVKDPASSGPTAAVARGAAAVAAGGPAAAASGGPAAPAGAPALSTKRFESIFSKELKNRERAAGPHEISVEAMACLHDWDGTGSGGVRCQICSFETKDRSYTCKFDCGVHLCGKCWWRWKEKA